MKKFFFLFVVLFSVPGKAETNLSDKSIVSLSKEIDIKLKTVCANDDSGENLFCRSIKLHMFKQFASFCRHLTQGMELKDIEESEVCNKATVSQFNEWVVYQSKAIHKELDSIESVDWSEVK